MKATPAVAMPGAEPVVAAADQRQSPLLARNQELTATHPSN